MSSAGNKPIAIPPELEAEMTTAVHVFVQSLFDRIAQLEREQKPPPKNSSLPPSTQHQHARPQPQRRKSKRKRGGQPGYEKHERSLIPTDQCDNVVPLRPAPSLLSGGVHGYAGQEWPPPAIAQLRWLNEGNGGMNMSYQVEADWTLLTTCNFRCNYCFTPPDVLGAKLKVYGTNVQWAEGFKATGKKWLLHLTGGEPCVYPGFVDLCQQLARDHYLSINSNLSHPSIDAFVERIDPERVHYINAAVHYDERQKRASLDVFVERVHRLRMHRFHVLVSIIMTPRIVAAFPAVSAYFESRGLFLIPKVMRANYRDQGYPAAYSSDQKAFILERLVEARRKYAAVTAGMGEAATIDMFADGRFLSGTVDYWGKLCGSGHNFVMIKADGTVLRCGSGNCLGNILLRNVSLLRGPQACDTSYCPYWCEKYTSPQFVRAE